MKKRWQYLLSRACVLVIFQCLIILQVAAQPPTITSFTPASGPIGTAVTITGTNFSLVAADNIVYFGAVKAVVSTASATSLTVTVPTGTTYQPITVTTNTLTAYTNKPFIVTFPSSGTDLLPNSFAAKIDYPTGSDTYDVAIVN